MKYIAFKPLGTIYGYRKYYFDKDGNIYAERRPKYDCCNLSIKGGVTDGGVSELKAGKVYTEFYKFTDPTDTEKHEFLALVDNCLTREQVVLNWPKTFRYLESKLPKGIKYASKGVFHTIATFGKANYYFKDLLGNVSNKVRAYRTKKGFGKETTANYAESLDLEYVPFPQPYIERGIKSVVDSKKVKSFISSLKRPGGSEDEVKWLRPFSVSQFTYKTPDQKLALEKENNQLRAKYGISIERYFLKSEPCTRTRVLKNSVKVENILVATVNEELMVEEVNVSYMNAQYKRCVDEGYTSFVKYAKDKHIPLVHPLEEIEDGKDGYYVIYKNYLDLKAETTKAYIRNEEYTFSTIKEAEAPEFRGISSRTASTEAVELLERLLYTGNSSEN